jgi:hypothetical protein
MVLTIIDLRGCSNGSWQMAVVGALGAIQYKQQGAIGKANQASYNSKGEALDNEAIQIEKQKDFDITQFNKEFQKLVGTEKVNRAKSGVGYEGTALRVAKANAEEAQLQRNITTYNSKMNKSQKLNEAAFSRIQGSMAEQQARMQKIQIASSFGSSLLTSGQTTKA